MSQGGGWQSSRCEQGHWGLHMYNRKSHPTPQHTVSAPGLWLVPGAGCWALFHSYVPVQSENPYPAVRSSSSPCNSKLTLCFFKPRKISQKETGEEKEQLVEHFLVWCAKANYPKQRWINGKAPLAVGEGSSWPFPQPGSMLLCTGICSPDFYLFQQWVAKVLKYNHSNCSQNERYSPWPRWVILQQL